MKNKKQIKKHLYFLPCPLVERIAGRRVRIVQQKQPAISRISTRRFFTTNFITMQEIRDETEI